MKDFKLNTQCSAGNGYFLQSTAGEFGIPVEQFADMAFGAEAMPNFGYGCAVFMQSDIVDFQRQGWKRAEIMAGLAAVLPKNIWLYVAQIPEPRQAGQAFVLQGGTQRNLAAVKAQVDFIESRSGARRQARKSSCTSTAARAAPSAPRWRRRGSWKHGRKTTFIGLDAVATVTYTTTTSEETRCHFCKNECLRTFIDVRRSGTTTRRQGEVDTRAGRARRASPRCRWRPARADSSSNNSCEKGLVEDVESMREIKKDLDARLKAAPNFVEKGARDVFKSHEARIVADAPPRIPLHHEPRRRRVELMKQRENIRIGIPRVLNQYSTNPLFSAYFEALGVRAAEPGVLGLHHRGTLQGRRQARLHRSVFPEQARHSARAQSAFSSTTRKSRSTSSSFPMIDDLQERARSRHRIVEPAPR